MTQRKNTLRIIILLPLVFFFSANAFAQNEKKVKTKKQYKDFKNLQEDRKEEDDDARANCIA